MTKLINLTCEQCDKTFQDYRSNKRRFCSRKCWYKFKYSKVLKTCSICDKEFLTPNHLKNRKSYCSTKCYYKRKPFRGKEHWHWRGGKFKISSGYIMIHSPEHPFCNNLGYVREHRLIAEKCLGRYLTQKECIHHINGVKDDNRPENLYYFKTHSLHKIHHGSGKNQILISNLV